MFRKEGWKMEQLAIAIAKGVFVKQSVTVGSKVINNKRVTKTDEKAFWLSLLILGIVVVVTTPLLPAGQSQEANYEQ
jgi:uncharacterized membrane protein